MHRNNSDDKLTVDIINSLLGNRRRGAPKNNFYKSIVDEVHLLSSNTIRSQTLMTSLCR